VGDICVVVWDACCACGGCWVGVLEECIGELMAEKKGEMACKW
jgi:hypothetical protein